MSHDLSWYVGTCISARIAVYKKAKDSNPHKIKTITDAAMIMQITRLLDQLPVKGDIMIKWSEEVPLIKLILHCQNSSYVILFYGNNIQTPATSFFKPQLPAERTLVDLLKKQF